MKIPFILSEVLLPLVKVSLFFGLVFLVALSIHIRRIQKTVQETGVLAIYHRLLQNDILQLFVSAASTVVVVLVYTLVTTTGKRTLFYPLVIARK